ncbi:MAG: hypothetical protein R6U51_08635 [Anaerolineales bacterium]
MRKTGGVVLELDRKKTIYVEEFPTPEDPASAENERNLTFFDMPPGLIFRYNQKRRTILNPSIQDNHETISIKMDQRAN